MAEDWIGRLAVEARTHDEQRDQQNRLRLHESEITAAKGQQFWELLVAAVTRDVLRFQQEFPHDPARSLSFDRTAPNCFRILRPACPAVSLEVEWRPASAEIQFQYSASRDEHSIPGWSGALVVRVDTSDNLYLSQYGRDFSSPDEVSRMFLERALTGVTF